MNTIIDRYTSIGPWVKIIAGLHNYQNFSSSPIFSNQGIPNVDISPTPIFIDLNTRDAICSSSSLTHIESDVWIGASVLIYSGVTIGRGSVISAGSLVTSNIPPYSICKGVPARVVRSRFTQEVISKLDQSEWWSYSPLKASQILTQLSS